MKVGNHVMKLNPSITQTSPEKRKYRVISVAMDLSKSPKWFGKTEKFYWIIMIKYVDTGEKVNLYFDYYDHCYKKENANN